MNYLLIRNGVKNSGRSKSVLIILFVLFLMNGSHERSAAQTSGAKSGLQQTTAARITTKFTTEELTRRADVVAVGTISDMRTDWNKEKTRIYTSATLSVQEVLKGNDSPSTLTITYPGGEIGTEGEVYSETASFKKHEEVMVFAKKDQSGNYRVTGGEQGKYTITTDKTSGKKMATSTTSLDDLKSQVKGYVKTQQDN